MLVHVKKAARNAVSRPAAVQIETTVLLLRRTWVESLKGKPIHFFSTR